jgi:PEP-CTERM motif
MPVTSVPEPETYAMMLVGLGLLATTRRRAGAARQAKATSR